MGTHWSQVLENVLQALALLAAALFFLFKAAQGYQVMNLTLRLELRRAARRDDHHQLVVALELQKGDRGTVRVDDLQITVREPGGQLFELSPLSLPANHRMSVTKEHTRRALATISWGQTSTTRPRLNLSPGEVHHIEMTAIVPSHSVITVEVAAVGRMIVPHRIGQWRCSAISLPADAPLQNCGGPA